MNINSSTTIPAGYINGGLALPQAGRVMLEALSLSIIVPFHNEAGSLREIIRRLAGVRFFNLREVEVIFVDDGSQDGSAKIAQQACEQHLSSGWRILTHLKTEAKVPRSEPDWRPPRLI